MGKLFGTDGIRGKANEELSCQTAFLLGQAVVKHMGTRVLVARDTRLSGEMFESAIGAGIMSAGGKCILGNIIPTPAVAVLVRENGFDAGVMISASHNPPEYNGLKVFDNRGLKLPDDVEAKIEEFILDAENNPSEGQCNRDNIVPGDEVGMRVPLMSSMQDYINFVVDSVKSQNIDFSGMKIALDVAHGASFATSRRILETLGAEVIAINETFTGTDINVNCGSTHLEALKKLVEESGADVGIAHDGDADRVMLVSTRGVEIDGDIILSVLAKDLKAQGKLKGNTVVGTVMSNLGLKREMDAAGINFEQTKVGDRYVLERMLEGDLALGGEQSGHVIMLTYNTTGDGIMSAVQFLAAVKRSGKTVDEAIASFEKFPQVLVNVEVDDKEAAMKNASALEEVAAVEAELGDEGRVLLRPSGTEPLIRVMVEAKTQEMAETCAKRIAGRL